MNFLAFRANFISSWIRIRIRNADPDPGNKSNADPCGIRMRNTVCGYNNIYNFHSSTTYLNFQYIVYTFIYPYHYNFP